MVDLCRVRVTGPLVEYVDGFRQELVGVGYSTSAAGAQLCLMADLSRWLAGEGLTVGDVTPARVEEFLAARRAGGRSELLSTRAVTPLLGYLRGLGVVSVAESAAVTPLDGVVADYRRYLVSERGLAQSSVECYVGIARRALSHWEGPEGFDWAAVGAGEVSAFVVGECRQRRGGSAKMLVKGLRSLLRFAFVAGYTSRRLAPAVPAVAAWSGGCLPQPVSAEGVAALLASCDGTPVGLRDHAIVTLLARLGLRAGEVAALALDDIDWHAGEIAVMGKGHRLERLPLPVDVGEALVAYLCDGRPRVQFRAVFVRAHAPIGPLTGKAVGDVVRRACVRAGVPLVGAHRLRHSAASAMLAGGASLAEIGQVLRHAQQATTAIYAKVDRVALRTLAQPWPGGAA